MSQQLHLPSYAGGAITADESSDGGVVLAVRGKFDDLVVHQLESLLAHADPESHAILDLAEARDFPDYAVATLARLVESAPGTVSLVGLGRHQRRILRYFGIEERDRTASRRAPRA